MTILTLVRHGESVWHAENRYAGSSDIALTDLGRRQAERLGTWAEGRGFSAVICSPLRRARDTAMPAGSSVGVVLTTMDALTECDFGAAEGRTMAEMRAEMPEAAAAFEADPVGHPWPGGEPPAAAADRAADALRAIAAGAAGPVLVVAHNTLLRLALCRLLEIPLARYRRVLPALRNVALSELRIDASGAGLLSLNVPIPSGDTP